MISEKLWTEIKPPIPFLRREHDVRIRCHASDFLINSARISAFFAELAIGAEHTMEEILYSEVLSLEEPTKEAQFMWALPGIYSGIFSNLMNDNIMSTS